MLQTINLQELQTVFEFEPHFRTNVAPAFFDYVAGGADGEHTIALNRKAFGLYQVRRGIRVNPASVDISTTIIGQRMQQPILIAPTSGHGNIHPEGAMETSRGAAEAGVTMILSAFNRPYERVLAATGEPLWYQIYPEFARNQDMILRALELGCPTIVLTVDSPYQPHMERGLRLRQQPVRTRWDQVLDPLRALRAQAVRTVERDPDNPYRLGRRMPDENWAFVEELRSFIDVPLVLKGIQTAEDALLAVEHGIGGIVVSNHGGRVLDFATPTFLSLLEIVDAVGGRIPVLVDSGFRTGADVLKALALGASAVLIGRPVLWGLGTKGKAGVNRVLEIIETELREAMAGAGCDSLADLDRSILMEKPV